MQHGRKSIRHIIFSDEFEEYYTSMNEQLKKKYDYALQIVKSQWSRLNFYEIQDLPLFLSRFWALKRECSELHDRWKGKKRLKNKGEDGM